MSWRDRVVPERMQRVGLVAPAVSLRAVLIEIATAGTVELDLSSAPVQPPGAQSDDVERALSASSPAPPVAGLVGWMPVAQMRPLADRIASVGGAVVPLRQPRGSDPPTLLNQRPAPHGAARLLVDTYGTIPYADVDPSWLAVASYVVMFGMMFGDVGQGAVLVACGVLLGLGTIRRLRRLRRMAAFVIAAGAAATAFGFLYGEFFGPTGVIPVLWLSPLQQPVPLLVAAMLLGSVLLAGAYAVGTVNRVREGGWGYALYSRTGIAGSLLFAAVATLVLGLLLPAAPLVYVATALAAAALVLIGIGLFVEAGGDWSGLLQAGVELVDTVVRLGSNLLSFARLAAFGLTHAALLAVVWSATTALWAPGWQAIAAIAVFLVGNALTFALEGLVAGIQALRLQYYELFSRGFLSEGRAFRPWQPELPADTAERTAS